MKSQNNSQEKSSNNFRAIDMREIFLENNIKVLVIFNGSFLTIEKDLGFVIPEISLLLKALEPTIKRNFLRTETFR